MQLRSLDVRKYYFTREDYIEFMCQPSCDEGSPSSALQVQCQGGELEIPTYEQDDSICQAYHQTMTMMMMMTNDRKFTQFTQNSLL